MLYYYPGGDERVCYIANEEGDESDGCVMRNSRDLVRLDSEGKLWYLGRTDDQIKRHGKRINLMQLEQVLFFFDLIELEMLSTLLWSQLTN